MHTNRLGTLIHERIICALKLSCSQIKSETQIFATTEADGSIPEQNSSPMYFCIHYLDAKADEAKQHPQSQCRKVQRAQTKLKTRNERKVVCGGYSASDSLRISKPDSCSGLVAAFKVLDRGGEHCMLS